MYTGFHGRHYEITKNVETIWRDEESVLVRDGFRPGERLVVSGLAAPVTGMAVRVESPDTKDTKQQKSTAK